MNRKRGCCRFCSLPFLDDFLVLLWASLVSIGVLGLIFIALPSLSLLMQQILPMQTAIMVTAHAFMVVSTLRFVQNCESTLYVMPIAYVVVHIVYWTGKIPTTNFFLGPVIPSMFVAMLLVPMLWVWERIKPDPRPTKLRRPPRVLEK